eukprot:TRINITY_DN1081_c0_g1_i2.p1 TRINITY_DN1081_c0_g1~~TRINITY_DN1081_c0_g1_i2.p1  ORF type:complete len:188 (-),score=33.98 TRINITY_DN1081_c0_g1_i2:34-597(-)
MAVSDVARGTVVAVYLAPDANSQKALSETFVHHNHVPNAYTQGWGGTHITVTGFKTCTRREDAVKLVDALHAAAKCKKPWMFEKIYDVKVREKLTVVRIHSATLDAAADMIASQCDTSWRVKGPKHSGSQWHVTLGYTANLNQTVVLELVRLLTCAAWEWVCVDISGDTPLWFYKQPALTLLESVTS